MTFDELHVLGVDCVGGDLVFKNMSVGRMTSAGPVLNEVGEEVLFPKPAVDPAKVARGPGRPRKNADVSDAVEVKAD